METLPLQSQDNGPIKEAVVACDIHDPKLTFAILEIGRTLALSRHENGTNVICTSVDVTREKLVQALRNVGLDIIGEQKTNQPASFSDDSRH